ncbi:MAG: DNA polymerase III subunit delta [Candidatus Nomurabacteria bacterium]|jgi:DNA polymerase-3 subunit delta|nr:DNA polymerase III subunit delta [Candidatus Nomurabacteria bacterium]
MIRVLFGENSFELERELARITANFDGEPERVSGEGLTKSGLADVLHGTTLFTSERLIVVRYLSDNGEVWERLIDIKSASNYVVLVESKIDKRSRVYKNLQSVAEMQEFTPFEARDFYKVQQWVGEEAASLGLDLNKKIVQYLTEVVGQNQWKLAQALDKLALLDKRDIDEAIINELIEKSADQNVFKVFENAMQGKTKSVLKALDDMHENEDFFRFFGLLVSQAFNLTVLVFSKKTPAELAQKLGVSPYGLGNLKKFSGEVSKRKMRRVLRMLNATDLELKTTNLEPKLVVKNLLVKISKL